MSTPEEEQSHAKIRRRGPDKCPTGPCSECGPATPEEMAGATPLEVFLSNHHFTDDVAFAHDETPPVAGLESWYVCKHCPAWVEDLPEFFPI